MAQGQGRRNSYTTGYGYRNATGGRYQYTNARAAYVQGNTARQLEALPVEYDRPRRQISQRTRKNQEKARRLNLGYVMFWAASMLVIGMVLTNYISLRSNITSSVKHIASMESELNSLKLDNDERIVRISSDMNLEDVKTRAIQELGMQYAEEGQIITFNSKDNDYVIQKGEIPD